MATLLRNFVQYVSDTVLLHPVVANTVDPSKIKRSFNVFLAVHSIGAVWAAVTYSRLPASAGPAYSDPLFNSLRPFVSLIPWSSPFLSKIAFAALFVLTAQAVLRVENPLSSRAVKRFFLIAAMLLSFRLILSSVTSIPSPDSTCAYVGSPLLAIVDSFFLGNCGGTMFDTISALATLCLLTVQEGYVRKLRAYSMEHFMFLGLWAGTILLTIATQRAYSIDVAVGCGLSWLLWTYYHLTRRIRPVRDALVERSRILAYTEGVTSTLQVF